MKIEIIQRQQQPKQQQRVQPPIRSKPAPRHDGGGVNGTKEEHDANKLWNKFVDILQDYRGDVTSQATADTDNECFACLEKVLNTIFLSIGVSLFLSVITVVLYFVIMGKSPQVSNSRLECSAVILFHKQRNVQHTCITM